MPKHVKSRGGIRDRRKTEQNIAEVTFSQGFSSFANDSPTKGSSYPMSPKLPSKMEKFQTVDNTKSVFARQITKKLVSPTNLSSAIKNGEP